MEFLRSIIDDAETPMGRAFDIFIQILIVISLVAFSLETLPDLSEQTYRILRGIELFVVAVFTVEYLLRIYVAKRRVAYLFSFWGLVDVLAILPFYLSMASVSTQALRILRLLRLFRMLKLVRYNQAMARVARAIWIAKEELILFGVISLMLLYMAALGIYHFEHAAQPENFRSIFDSLWWAVATLTTVGYGDIYPITAGGRLFTFVILMLGLGVVAVPTGIIASALAAARREMPSDSESVEQDQLNKKP